jgi:hypothetical protein
MAAGKTKLTISPGSRRYGCSNGQAVECSFVRMAESGVGTKRQILTTSFHRIFDCLLGPNYG